MLKICKYNAIMFLTKQCQILLFSKQKNKPKINKNSTSRMFDANNISTRSYLHHIKTGTKIN